MSKSPKHILFVFLDGLGLGANNPEINPLAHSWPALESLNNGNPWTIESNSLLGIDANLDMDGLPQSGTGQASLFTGINCAHLAGRHFGPYPHSKTKSVIAEKNIFQQLIEKDIDKSELAFANAYPDRFFSFVEKTGRWTVTTLCCKSSGIKLRTKKDVLEGQAVTADLTGKGWLRAGHDLPHITAKEAGRRVAHIAKQNRFTLFEYYLTDKAGHGLDMDRAMRCVEDVDHLFAGISESLDFEESLLLVTSDHGNLEDISVKTHTRNFVPLVKKGICSAHFSEVSSLTDIVPKICSTI